MSDGHFALGGAPLAHHFAVRTEAADPPALPDNQPL